MVGETEAKARAPSLLAMICRAAPAVCARAQREYSSQLLDDLSNDDVGASTPGPPSDLPGLIDAWLATHPDRRRDGVYLTPRASARALLRGAAADGFRPRSVCDPAVGAGIFLEEALSLFGPGVEVWGIDRDPVAVALSRLAVWLFSADVEPIVIARRIRLADALLDRDPFAGAAPPEGFDLICGNPPFGNAIEKRTARPESERRALQVRFPETARGPYDRSLLFVDLATTLLSPRGRYALLVPRALMAARYATGLREMLARAAPIERIVRFANDAPVPECEIFMVGWIGSRPRENGATPVSSARASEADSSPVTAEWAFETDEGMTARIPNPAANSIPRGELKAGSWGILLDPDGARNERSAAPHPRLGDFFEVSASASVAEAYAIAGAIREAHDDEERGGGWRFLTVRLITRYRHRWGSVGARFLGRLLRAPFLPREAAGLTSKRGALYDRPKIIVAGLSRVVKAVCDAEGDLAGSVGTISAVPRDAGGIGAGTEVRVDAGIDSGIDARTLLRRGTLLLNSAWISAVHRARRGPVALAGGSIPLGKDDLAGLPFPALLAGKSTPAAETSLRELLAEIDAMLPSDPKLLLGILDAAAEALLDRDRSEDADQERWDLLVQRVIEAIAGRE
jgi:hypothetical protein